MKKGIIGKKLGMTQVFDEAGRAIPVTVILTGPAHVVQIKTIDKDGYNAVQLAMEELKPQHVKKAIKGHFDKAKIKPMKHLAEFRLDDISNVKIGDVFDASLFEEGEKVDVQGISKGKGFQGVIKRYGQKRGRMSHGSKFHRKPGSIGASSTPSRVFKNKQMPGRMGGVLVTTQNLLVVKVDKDKNVILVKGSIPGPKKSIVRIKNAVKASK